MNWRLVFHILSALCILVGAAMLPSLGIAILGPERSLLGSKTAIAFGVSIAVCVFLGVLLRHLTREAHSDRVTPSDGFAIATLGWLLMAGLGALPLYLSAESAPLRSSADHANIGMSPGPSFTYLDAYFETMSGFTTTGASVFGTARTVTDSAGHEIGRGIIEALPPSFLFWRSLTHWLGGMGIVVLCLAILPTLHAGGYPMFQAEVPGPTAERLRPRIRETAAILWGVYILLSSAETLLLWLGDMPLLDSLCHTFGTMATGGFSTKDASIGHYSGLPHGLYIEIVIDIFMFLAGCNFLLHFQALHGNPKGYFRNTEFKFYVLVLAAAILIITIGTRMSGLPGYASTGASLRKSVFQVLSITTTTGFCTADFDLWPGMLRCLMVLLMFMGGCAGSTGGGLKQVRILVVAKYIFRELKRLLRPELQNRIRVGDETMDERLVANIVGLALLWLIIFALATFAVCASLGSAHFPGHHPHVDSELSTALTAVAATLNNIGPGLSGVGATCNYGWMPAAAKFILIICMLMGRLEVYSVVVLLLPLAWRR